LADGGGQENSPRTAPGRSRLKRVLVEPRPRGVACSGTREG
jgi:hypothetical protein